MKREGDANHLAAKMEGLEVPARQVKATARMAEARLNELDHAGQPDTRIAIVGGDQRVLLAPWPPWYDMLHFAGGDGNALKKCLLAGKVQLVVLLTRWCDESLKATAKKHARCPVHHWPRGIGELLRGMPEIIEQHKKKPEPKQAEPTPEPRKPRAKQWVEQASQAPAKKPEPKKEESLMVEQELPVLPPEAPVEPPASSLDVAAQVVGDRNRADSWTKEEVEMLICAWDACQGDADRLVADFRTLGGTRTNTAIQFQLLRVLGFLGQRIPEAMVKRLRKLTEPDRKKRDLYVVETRTPKTAVPDGQLAPTRQELLDAMLPPIDKLRSGYVGPLEPSSAQPPPPTKPIATDDKLRLRIEYEVLGVEMGLKTKQEAYDAIVALVRIRP